MNQHRHTTNIFLLPVLFTSVLFILALHTGAAAKPVSGNGNEFALLDSMTAHVQKHTLNNGLTVLTLEVHTAPVVSVQFWVKTGSRNEHPGITGISHLFEHMMYRGSKKYGPEEMDHILQRVGGLSNAFTSNDVTCYYEDLPSDQLELAIHLEAEHFANLKINDSVLQYEKQVVGEERRMDAENQVQGAAMEQLEINAFHSSPYSWPILGWMDDIMHYTVSDVQNYYKLHYAPNNVIGVIVGDFKEADAMKLVEKYWGKIPRQETPPAPTTKEIEQKGERRAVLKFPCELPMLMAAYQIPPDDHQDMPALSILSGILSRGKSSRLYQRLVYTDRLTRYVYCYPDARIGAGIFVFGLEVAAGKTFDDAEKALWEEVDRLKKDGVTDAELIKAKNQTETSVIGFAPTMSSRGMILGSYETERGDYHKFVEDIKAKMAVTKEDIIRVAKKYLDSDHRTVLQVVPVPPEEVVDDGKGGGK